MVGDGLLELPACARARLAEVRTRAAGLLEVLDEMGLSQAAAHLSMSVDALDRAAAETLPGGRTWDCGCPSMVPLTIAAIGRPLKRAGSVHLP